MYQTIRAWLRVAVRTGLARTRTRWVAVSTTPNAKAGSIIRASPATAAAVSASLSRCRGAAARTSGVTTITHAQQTAATRLLAPVHGFKLSIAVSAIKNATTTTHARTTSV